MILKYAIALAFVLLIIDEADRLKTTALEQLAGEHRPRVRPDPARPGRRVRP